MRIAVIGVGNVGSALARACAAAGHTVVVSAGDPGHARVVAAEIGCEAAGSNVEAVTGADMVAFAVPSTAIGPLTEELADHVGGKVVVDPTNPVKEDYSGLLTESGSAAEGIALLLPDAAVVKAFNTVFASSILDPVLDGVPLDGLYAGDDELAKASVAELLAGIGFRPLDCGPLEAARTLEEMAFLNISLNARNGWPWRSGWKLLGPTG